MPSYDHARPRYKDGIQLGEDDIIFGSQIIGSDASTNPTTPRAVSARATGAARPLDVALMDLFGVHIGRSIISGQDSIGTGILATGVLAQFDDENINTVTEDRFAPIRMSVRRALLSEGVRFGTPQPISDNESSLTIDTEGVPPISVDGNVFATQEGCWNMQVQDQLGNRLAFPYANPIDLLDGNASATGTANTSIIPAQGIGYRIYVTSIVIANSSATNAIVNIKDGTTTKLVYPAPSNSGAIHQLVTPLRLSPNNAFQFASGTSVTTMYVSAIGYRSVL